MVNMMSSSIIRIIAVAVFAQLVSPVSSFLSATTIATAIGQGNAGGTIATTTIKPASSSSAAASSSSAISSTDDLLRPSYEIESIATRIGHGFDIHRMAPLKEAGQPVVIGGVEILHKDQKVCA